MSPSDTSTELTYHGRPVPLSERAYQRFDQNAIDLLSDSVAKGADLATLYRFLEIAARYELDPYTGEIWCANMAGRDGGAGRMAILVGRDGYLKVARRDESFIDVDADVVYSEDEYRVVRTADGNRTVEHSYGNPARRGDALGAYAVLRREGKPDRYFYAPLDQYAKQADKSAWKYRDAMVIKCAVSYIARTTYGVSGPVPIDEIEGGLELPAETPEMAAYAAAAAGTRPPTLDLPESIRDLFAKATELDPKSWRRNEVEARVFGPGGEVLFDQVRDVERDLREWLADNEGVVDAEVVEGPEYPGGTKDATEPAEPEGPDLEQAAPGDPPADPERIAAAERLEGLRARGRELQERVVALPDPDSREAHELSAELDNVEAEIRKLAGEGPGQDALDV